MAKIAVAENLELFPILSRFPPQGTKSPLTGIARLAAVSSPAGEGHQIEMRSLGVRSILNRSVSRRGLSFAWSINPYRGCEFACRYCYARYTHEFMELQPEDFERKIFIKQNAAWLLEQELKQVRPGEEIALGTATDPYQPVERHARVTESLLEVLAGRSGLRIGVVTKSTLIERDIPLLQRIAETQYVSASSHDYHHQHSPGEEAGTAGATAGSAVADRCPAPAGGPASGHLVLAPAARPDGYRQGSGCNGEKGQGRRRQFPSRTTAVPQAVLKGYLSGLCPGAFSRARTDVPPAF